MSFPDELSAFREYASLYPKACLLLVDTYDTLRSGVPNAIRVFTEMRENGIPLTYYGIRLDSGDLAYLSKKARRMLDDAGFPDAVISASSDLDENLIAALKTQGAAITSWGVGTNLITSKDNPSFGGVYKLSAVQREDGSFIPKIKLSENTEKVTNPGNKTIYRVYMPFFIEVNPRNTDKGNSLMCLLNGMGVNPEQVVCCGDGGNDIPMIETAGLGVAMHLDDFTDQSLSAYPDNVIHIRVTHTFRDDQRSRDFLNCSCTHLDESPTFLLLLSIKKNIGPDCLFHCFLDVRDALPCIAGNAGNQDHSRCHLFLEFLYFLLYACRAGFRHVHDRVIIRSEML